MAEYIERDAVLSLAKDICVPTKWDSEYRHRSIDPGDVRELPAADVQPVRHGRWIKDSDGLTICSECEEVALQRVFIKLPEKIVDLQMRESHYCPICGAKMDGGENNI